MRPGGIGVDEITRVLGRAPAAPGVDAPRASGTLASHYAPHAPAHRVPAGALLRNVTEREAERGARRRPRADHRATGSFAGAWIAAQQKAPRYAHDLYANLRALDVPGITAMLIEDVPDDDAWLAVRDRLARAVFFFFFFFFFLTYPKADGLR